MKQNKLLLATIAITLVLGFTVTATPLWSASKEEINQKKADIRKMAKETLNRLYKAQPSAKNAISKSAGYAVFSNFGTKIFLVGGGGGKGVVYDNKTKKETFMKMGSLGAGVGMGVKDFRAVFIFYDKNVLNNFVEKGWEFGGQADAAAKSDEKGGAAEGSASVQKGMEIYQFTESGLALQAKIQGTKYWKDKDLN